MDIKSELIKIGLKPKEAAVYLHLVNFGPSSIRDIASKSGINRGSVFEALKILRKEQLVSFYEQEKKQKFMAEDPRELTELLERKKSEISKKIEELTNIVPQIRSMYSLASDKPTIKYFEKAAGSKKILRDILEAISIFNTKEYYAYSPSADFIYEEYSNFNEDRIKQNIHVKAIAFKKSGDVYGKDERKWLPKADLLPTYTFIYANKLAMISKDENNFQRGVIIEDKFLFETQLTIFNNLWETL